MTEYAMDNRAARGSNGQTGMLPWLGYVVCPIVVGALIYILLRSTDILIFRLLDALRLTTIVSQLRLFVAPMRPALPPWILFNLPDGLWAYSASACLLLIWRRKLTASSIVWVASVPILGIGSEALRFLGYVPGSFDPMDIVSYLCGPFAALAMVSFLPSLRKE